MLLWGLVYFKSWLSVRYDIELDLADETMLLSSGEDQTK